MARPTRRRALQSQPPAPSQSQRAGPSRTQTSRRNAVVASDDEEAEEIPADVDGGESDEEREEEGDGFADVIYQKASDLARLALFHEARRLPLRREDINKKVLQNSRQFKLVYDKAQVLLRTRFGLELQELPSKAGLDQEAAQAAENKKNKKGDQAAQDEDELEEARKAATGKKRATTIGSKTYILRSVLDAKLIELANKTDAEILEEEAMFDFGSGEFFGGGAGAGINDGALIDDEDDWDDSTELHPRTHGSILSWSGNDQLGALGVLYVILALILVNGKVVQERILRAQLKELGLSSAPSRSLIHLTTISTHRSLKLDDYLSQLLRQGYLDRQVVGEVSGTSRKRARGKVGADGNNDGIGGAAGEMYEWRWGARAFCEVGEEDIAKFVAEFMVNHGAGAGTEEGDDEDGPTDERRKGKVKKMYKGVEKAAGGTLDKIRDWDH